MVLTVLDHSAKEFTVAQVRELYDYVFDGLIQNKQTI